ncbi:hypothetical protein BY996DRAFT_6409929 [Phakopsora pachyrhizi]|nr:hypothetical protein BY996DRAFT_6409929 [Phakopsora pachyrhizi]
MEGNQSRWKLSSSDKMMEQEEVEDTVKMGVEDEEEEMEDHSNFEAQRSKLIDKISDARVYNNLNALNRSVESVNLIGRQFHHVNDLWSKFEQVFTVPPSQDESIPSASSPKQKLDALSPNPGVSSTSSRPTDDRSNLPQRVASGGDKKAMN